MTGWVDRHSCALMCKLTVVQRRLSRTLGLYDRASRRLLMNETNRCTVNFHFFINGTIALHVSGSFYAHHQDPDPDSSRSPSCIKLYQSRCTADNAPDDGQKNARNMYSYCAINKKMEIYSASVGPIHKVSLIARHAQYFE